MSPALSPPPAAAPGPGMLARETGCHTPLLSVAGSPGRHTLHFPPGGHASSSEPEAAPSHVKHQPLGVLPIPGPLLRAPEQNSLLGRPGVPSWSFRASPGAQPSFLLCCEVRGPRSGARRAWPTWWSGHSRFPLGKRREGASLTAHQWEVNRKWPGGPAGIPSCSVDKPQQDYFGRRWQECTAVPVN